MQLNIKLLGLQQITKVFSGFKNKLASSLNDGMKEAAFEVERAAKVQITSGPNRAIDTGYLRSSIMVTSLSPFRATVSPEASYGIYVHEGTRFMRARPFLAEGLKDAVPEIEKIFGKRVTTLIQTI